ncbi:hypothetical protein [Roseibacillus ishigakijimensis]|uniref:DUF2268 domain-containing protein n=1 Tax=Roseibacillus ishigakijimensis TaxID=454146 RepID=A0A934VLE8_9BACT|nr:hypothetical protein [Roseibacillus ishigakijimensis]MBK1833162.1 hypothetical protein [Roseibacillus ishigakijimensis]
MKIIVSSALAFTAGFGLILPFQSGVAKAANSPSKHDTKSAPPGHASKSQPENRPETASKAYISEADREEALAPFLAAIASDDWSRDEIQTQFAKHLDFILVQESSASPIAFSSPGEEVFTALCQKDIALVIELVPAFLRYPATTHTAAGETLVDHCVALPTHYLDVAAQDSEATFLQALKASRTHRSFHSSQAVDMPANFDYRLVADEMHAWLETHPQEHFSAMPFDLFLNWGMSDFAGAVAWLQARPERDEARYPEWSFAAAFRGYRGDHTLRRPHYQKPSAEEIGTALGQYWHQSDLDAQDLLAALRTNLTPELLAAFVRASAQ